MKHNGDQGFPDQFTTMTNEDWAEFDKHAEAEHEKLMKSGAEPKPFIPEHTKPPF
jgi:hypothetical protein